MRKDAQEVLREDLAAIESADWALTIIRPSRGHGGGTGWTRHVFRSVINDSCGKGLLCKQMIEIDAATRETGGMRPVHLRGERIF
jgi:hypothetical protein